MTEHKKINKRSKFELCLLNIICIHTKKGAFKPRIKKNIVQCNNTIYVLNCHLP